MTRFSYTFHACSHVSKESIWRFRWPLITYVTSLETGSTRGLVSGTLVVEGTLRVDNKSAKSRYSPLAAACAVFSVMFGAQLPAEGGMAGLVSGAVVCDESFRSLCVLRGLVGFDLFFQCIVLELYVLNLG